MPSAAQSGAGGIFANYRSTRGMLLVRTVREGASRSAGQKQAADIAWPPCFAPSA